MAKRFFKRNRAGVGRLLFFILLSLALHSLLFFVKIETSSGDEENLVSIKYYDPLNFPAAKSQNKETVPPPKEREKPPQGQIVDIAKPEIEKKPKKSNFLSEYDSSVTRESKSKFDPNIAVRGKKLKTKLAEKAEIGNSDSGVVLSKNGETANDSEQLKKIKSGEIKGFTGQDGKYMAGKEKERAGRIGAKDKISEEGVEIVGGRQIPKRYLPYFNGLDSALTTPSNDFLNDVEEKDETLLNTKKFLHAAYFNKIKLAVSQHWTPGAVLSINDPQGHLYGRKNRFTHLVVYISSNGELVNVKVDASSGIDFLDREAINAFKMASPFSAPPEILLNENKLLEIRFGFMVTME